MKRRTSSHSSSVGGCPSDCNIMASGSTDATAAGEPADAAEECSGKKKSKFQTFKNFFVKKKKKESATPSDDGVLKASQSSDDVNSTEQTAAHANQDNESESKINMGSKAMSHDSVFVSDSPSLETNEALRASQDSIHGKVKSLQLQLKQVIRLGSPPSLLCGRKGEDTGALSEDDGLPCSPPEYSSLHNVLATPPHTSAGATYSGSSLSMEASDSEDDQMSYEASSRPATPHGSVPVDFSLPASTVSCLDSSAARHRIAVKAKARAKRKPASRQMLESKRRDLRERVLLRDTEEKLRMVTSIEEEEHEYLPGEQCNSSEHDAQKSETRSFTPEDDDKEVTDQCQKTSPASSISAEDFSEGEESIPDEDHVPKSDVQESPWESPVTLELQSDDFLLDTGCEVVPEEQGSLLEEVLSSLKSPLTSGLALESENVVRQCEEADISSESVAAELEEESSEDLLDSSEPMMTTNEQAPLPDSLSESTIDSEDTEETSEEEEELLEPTEFAEEVSTDASHQVPEDSVEKVVSKAESVKEEEGNSEEIENNDSSTEEIENNDSSTAFEKIVDVKETHEDENIEEDGDEEEAKVERETKDIGDEDEHENELMEVYRETEDMEKKDEATAVEELKDISDQTGPLEPEEHETSFEETESSAIDVELIPAADQTVSADAFTSPKTVDQPQISALPSEQPGEEPSSTLSHIQEPNLLNSPILQPPLSDMSMYPVEKEEELEPSKLQPVSSETQEVSSEKFEVVYEQPEVPESPKRHEASTTEIRPRFTIAPAWQRSLATGATKEQPQIIPLLVPETKLTNESSINESPQTTELLTPLKEERPSKPARTQSSPALPLRREMAHAQEESTPENPFGVRLRKTPVLHRYGLDGESAWSQTQTESSEAQGTPGIDQHGKKPVLPKKPDLLDTVSPKKSPDAVGRISVGDTESPSWISVARQKQKNFIENSPEVSPEKLPPQEDLKKQSSLPSLPSSPITKEQITPSCSPLKVSCSLEISNTSMVEKESKRTSNPSTAPLAQDEPPWLALAKKKAKAWSEMPQIVQ